MGSACGGHRVGGGAIGTYLVLNGDKTHGAAKGAVTTTTQPVQRQVIGRGTITASVIESSWPVEVAADARGVAQHGC
ncbi:hypothetical protein [Mycobacterium riyadhense]|uniref:hypothetical protein n=1 Tax=Mycobacterium riyadhense TaxID=486698 RepID=UPI001958A4FE|nr:hypothetical protein [Mycobacterium riyadhense]